jgi:hypothetical protein
MLKKVLIALGSLVVLGIVAIGAAVAFTPTKCNVEREIVINKPKAEVFAYAKMLKNQNEWGPWFKKEPTMEQHFTGTDGTVGFISHWKGTEISGEGEQEIKKIVEGERLETELRFTSPMESKADTYLTTEAAGENQTKVKWGFSSEMPRPFNVMLLFIDMDELIGKDFQDGLGSMKAILEK